MDESHMHKTDFLWLFLRLRAYRERKAFVLTSRSVSYQQFTDDICRLTQILPPGGNWILPELSDKYRLAVAYFATVLSGNTACLLPSADVLQGHYSCFDSGFKITNELMDSALALPEAKLNYRTASQISTVLFSSGTTAIPKAVALSEENILSDLMAGIERFEYSPEDRILSLLPFTHVFGLVCDLCAPLCCGAAIAFAYGLPEFFLMLPEYRPTTLHLTPGVAALLLRRLKAIGELEPVMGDSLTRIMSGGASTPSWLCEEMKSYGIAVYGCYGLTECACGVALCSRKSDRIGSVGRPLSCCSVHIDESGHILVGGKNVMLGYLDETGVLLPLRGGIFETGDLGLFDEDGFLYIAGRADELILFSDGKKLMPQRAEQAIELVTGVAEAIVYTTGNDRLETLVYPETGAKTEQIAALVRSLDFNGHKLTAVRFSKEPLAKTPAGKIDRGKYGKQQT